MADVVGYERRDPAVLARLRAGYPRFVLNALVAEARDAACAGRGLDSARTLPLRSLRAADRAVALARPGAHRVAEVGGWALLEVDAPSLARVADMVRHAGLRLASRDAETWLARGSVPPGPAAPPSDILARLAPLVAPCGADDLRLAGSGMGAVAAAVDAVRAVQAPRGRGAWIQLGWLYVDTAEYLRKTLAPGETLEVLPGVTDVAALRRALAAHRGRVAGIVAELPNNPLLASPDLDLVRELARAEGALTVLDPSSSGLVNVDLMPWADILVTSLTKYSGHRGDLMAGLLAVNPSGPDAAALRAAAFAALEPLGHGDLAALAAQLPAMDAVADAQNRAARRIADFLAGHPAVTRVLAADRGPTAAAYARAARGPARPGSLITFSLRGELARFYDRVALPKGPSFGLGFTLLAPFLWLSHFEQVTTEQGRAGLRAAGLDPDLVRLSVGTEDPEAIIRALDEALRD
jgi:cystathionine gamma-synthase